MSQVIRAALNALKADLENVSGMTGKVRAVAPDAQDVEFSPGITLVAQKFKFLVTQREAISRPTSTSQLWQVGRLEGKVQIRVMGKEPAVREAVSEGVFARFFSQTGRRGTLLLETDALTLAGTATLYEAPCSFTLASAEWNEERVFDRKRYCFMDVDCSVPLLVAEAAVPLMATIVLHVTHDMTTEWDPPVPLAKTYDVNEDGTATLQ